MKVPLKFRSSHVVTQMGSHLNGLYIVVLWPQMSKQMEFSISLLAEHLNWAIIAERLSNAAPVILLLWFTNRLSCFLETGGKPLLWPASSATCWKFIVHYKPIDHSSGQAFCSYSRKKPVVCNAVALIGHYLTPT